LDNSQHTLTIVNNEHTKDCWREAGRRLEGDWRWEAGGWRREAGGRRQEAGGWRLEAGGWRLKAVSKVVIGIPTKRLKYFFGLDPAPPLL
jgi:hypothetical protein